MPHLPAELPALKVNANLSQCVASELKPGPALKVRATTPWLFPGILLEPDTHNTHLISNSNIYAKMNEMKLPLIFIPR